MPTNATFRRIHNLLASPPRQVFAKYVASADNPADGPSRGKYPPAALLLPQITIPEEISSHILDFNNPSGFRTLTLLGPPAMLELQERVKTVTLQDWAESTRATYGAGLLVYHVFCDSREVLEKDHALAKAALVASFVSVLTGSLSGKAIHNYIYGVRAWHTLYRLPWVLHEEQIATMLKGIAKLTPPALKQDKRKPITIRIISLIKDKLDQTNSLDAAFFACLTTIFYSAAQVSKFTPQRLDAFNPTEHITHGNARNDIDRNDLHTKVFALPRTKSSPTGKEVHWARQDGSMDPLDAFDRHIAINDPPSTTPYLLTKQ
ncbi:hypothetical protein V8E55_004994 [Tylopilus felleus]